FCQRMLVEYAFESKLRFDVDLIADQRSLVQQIVQDFWAREVNGLGDAEVRFLQSQQVNLKDLSSLAYIAIQWPEMPLVSPGPVADPSATLERYLLARQQAAALWHRAGSEVRQLLQGCVSLNKSSYKPEK